MLVKEMNAALAPFKLLCNKNAMAMHYKALKVGPAGLAGAASFGMAEVRLKTGITAEFCVDAWTFISIMGSLADDSELTFALESGEVLTWKAGASRGKLATLPVKDMPSVDSVLPKPEPAAPGKRARLADSVPGAWTKPPPSFVSSLALGSLSCGANSMASLGVYGVCIDNSGDKPLVLSSDNTTISCCEIDVEKAGMPLDGQCALPPEAAELLISVCNTTGSLVFLESSIYYHDDWIRLVVNKVPAFKQDIRGLIGHYLDAEVTVPIAPEAIQAFVKRAMALAESKKDTHVIMSAADGQLGLSFSQGVANTDEVYLVEDLQMPDMAEVHLDALKLARALVHVDTLVLDHIHRGIIVLKGSKPEFRYLISGRKQG